MAEIVFNCPRCKAAHTTFDVSSSHTTAGATGSWQIPAELFARCRNCHRSTIMVVVNKKPESERFMLDGIHKLQGNVTPLLDIVRFINIKDTGADPGPDYLPEDIQSSWNEGAACLSIGCPNAAAAMFRLCVDHATRGHLPSDDQAPNNKIRRSLGLRMEWLFDNNLLPGELRELSDAIKEDGNDGAHAGTLSMADAEDIRDFTYALLERLYTEPAKLKLAADRRRERRALPQLPQDK